MTRGLKGSLAASAFVLLAGCSALDDVDIGDTNPTPAEMLRDFRCDLSDAGLAGENLRYCAVAPFYDKCPLRICIEQIGRIIAMACPAPDSGLPPVDEQLCAALGEFTLPTEVAPPGP